jgi:hypothetical protein
MTRAKALVAGIVGLLAFAGAVSAAGTPSVTITSPKTGSTFSAQRTPTLTVAGAAAFTVPAQTSTTFYLRRDGCGTPNDNPHLSVTSGTDGGEGCGFVGGNGLVAGVSPGLFSVDYPSTDGMPLILDTSRSVDGVHDLQNDVAGTGQVTLDFTLEALVGGDGIVVGTVSETVLVTPAQSDYPVEFHITPTAALEQASLSGIDLNVYIHGAYSDSGYIGNSGKSWLTVPGWSASPDRTVEVSVDDPAFGSPVAATLNGSANGYSTSVPMPAVGRHTVYARATQGYDVSAVASSAFTVKK